MILDLQLAHSLCLSELLPSLQPAQTDISHIPPPVSQPQSQVGMRSHRATTRESVVMSMCRGFFSPTEEWQTGEAIQCAPLGHGGDVEGLTRHGPHQSPDGHKPERESSGEHCCAGEVSSSVFIHGREELENAAECQLVTPEQLQEVAA